MAVYVLFAAVLYAVSVGLQHLGLSVWVRLPLNTVLLVLFVAYILKRDLPVKQLPVIGRFFR